MNQKKIAGERAAEYIKDGMIAGLGTGSTAKYLVDKVGEMEKNIKHMRNFIPEMV